MQIYQTGQGCCRCGPLSQCRRWLHGHPSADRCLGSSGQDLALKAFAQRTYRARSRHGRSTTTICADCESQS